MKTFAQIALISSLAAAPTLAANLRSTAQQELEEQRNLQIINAELLNAIVSTLVEPVLDDTLQTVLGNNFDPIYLGEETTIQTPELELSLPPNGLVDVTCRSSVSLTYGLGYVSGLSSIRVNSLEMVPGTEDIQIGMNVLTPTASWSGTWNVNTTLDSLTAETSITLKAQACGVPLEQKVTGTTTIHNPTLQAALTMGGDTDNLIQMTETTEITTAQVESVTLELGTIDAGISLAGTLIPEFALGNSFDAFLLNGIVDDLEPRIVDLLNQALTQQLPSSFSG